VGSGDGRRGGILKGLPFLGRPNRAERIDSVEKGIWFSDSFQRWRGEVWVVEAEEKS
jgi:hypothetical protein